MKYSSRGEKYISLKTLVIHFNYDIRRWGLGLSIYFDQFMDVELHIGPLFISSARYPK